MAKIIDANNNDINKLRIYSTNGSLYIYLPEYITFKIGETSITAELGMTWEEWLNSSYSEDNEIKSEISIDNRGYIIKTTENNYLLDSEGALIKNTSKIKKSENYIFVSPQSITVDGVTYKFIEGMTWSQFINSAFQSTPFSIEESHGYKRVKNNNTGKYIKKSDSIFVNWDDVLLNSNNAEYVTAKRIMFTCDSITYEAEEGMTWLTFIYSGYENNFIDIIVNRDYDEPLLYVKINGTSKFVKNKSGGFISQTSLITEAEYESIGRIGFMFDGDDFEAEEGMTWSQWIGSEYNWYNGFEVKNDYVIFRQDSYFITPEGDRIKATELIPNNYIEYEYSNINEPTFSYYVTEEGYSSEYCFARFNSEWFESQNKTKGNSVAGCRVHLDVNRRSQIQFELINYAESKYDYGYFGVLDKDVGTSTNAVESTSDTIYATYKGASSSTVKTLTYSNISRGLHHIDIRFRKDISDNYNNDSLKWKIIQEIEDTSLSKITKAPVVYSYSLYHSNGWNGTTYANLGIQNNNNVSLYVYGKCYYHDTDNDNLTLLNENERELNVYQNGDLRFSIHNSEILANFETKGNLVFELYFLEPETGNPNYDFSYFITFNKDDYETSSTEII